MKKNQIFEELSWEDKFCQNLEEPYLEKYEREKHLGENNIQVISLSIESDTQLENSKISKFFRFDFWRRIEKENFSSKKKFLENKK